MAGVTPLHRFLNPSSSTGVYNKKQKKKQAKALTMMVHNTYFRHQRYETSGNQNLRTNLYSVSPGTTLL